MSCTVIFSPIVTSSEMIIPQFPGATSCRINRPNPLAGGPLSMPLALHCIRRFQIIRSSSGSSPSGRLACCHGNEIAGTERRCCRCGPRVREWIRQPSVWDPRTSGEWQWTQGAKRENGYMDVEAADQKARCPLTARRGLIRSSCWDCPATACGE